jgi:glycosyltransferase involved in cell wall biosynthesis
MKKLSIITINYNNCNGLKKTIESVIEQTYTDYEYIIIDGGSTDGSLDVIKKYDKKIDYWISEPDRGIYNAMNKGILKATGEYCNFMNSGDFFYNKNVLEKVFNQNNEDIITGKTHLSGTSLFWDYNKPTITLADLWIRGLNHQSTFIKTQLLRDNPYDESLKILADLNFFARSLVLRNCTFKFIDEVIADYNLEGISSLQRKEMLDEKDQILKSILPERIYIDYIRYINADSPLLELTPILNKTNRFNKFIYKLDKTLIFQYLFIKESLDKIKNITKKR